MYNTKEKGHISKVFVKQLPQRIWNPPPTTSKHNKFPIPSPRRIWNQRTRGVDCGDAVANWLSQLLYKGETRVRLLYQGGLVRDRPARKPDYFEFPQFKPSDRVREAAAEPMAVMGAGGGERKYVFVYE